MTPETREKDNQHSREGHEIGDEIGNHMRIEKLKIPRVVDDAAHQIAGLFVVEKSEVEALKFVIKPASEVSHKIPCRTVRKVVGEKTEQHAQKIEQKKRESEIPNGCQCRLIHTRADDAGHFREYLRRRQVDDRQRKC